MVFEGWGQDEGGHFIFNDGYKVQEIQLPSILIGEILLVTDRASRNVG